MKTTRSGFSRRPLYKVKKASALRYAKQKLSFVIASMSIFAFVVGNMVGQNGWYAFWKSVLGKDIDATIVFTGTVPPIARVPDYRKWSQYGGTSGQHTFRQVPESVLVPLPEYDPVALARKTGEGLAEQIYAVAHLGDYDIGNDHGGSHIGIDIPTPVGTPALAIANGVVELSRFQSYGFGNHVMIRIPNVPDPKKPGEFTTLYVTYAHLDSIIVEQGQLVNKGQQIGTTGKSGEASGPHLHIQTDLASAPYHPYWPFTTAELAAAKLTFNQAINSGFNQDRGDLYTINPMLFVQQYTNYAAPTMIAANPDAAAVRPAQVTMSLPERVDYRRAQRMARVESVVRVAIATPAPVVTAPVSSAPATTPVSSSSSSASAEVPVAQSSVPLVANADTSVVPVAAPVVPTKNDVDRFSIEHNGGFDRTWQKIFIRALNADGDTVENPSFTARLFLVPTFGDAKIAPTNELSPAQFVKGVATLNILARDGAKTLIFETKSNDPKFEAVSAPMVYTK